MSILSSTHLSVSLAFICLVFCQPSLSSGPVLVRQSKGRGEMRAPVPVRGRWPAASNGQSLPVAFTHCHNYFHFLYTFIVFHFHFHSHIDTITKFWMFFPLSVSFTHCHNYFHFLYTFIFFHFHFHSHIDTIIFTFCTFIFYPLSLSFTLCHNHCIYLSFFTFGITEGKNQKVPWLSSL